MPVLVTKENSPDQGSVVVGFGAHWDAIAPGTSGQVLTVDPTTASGLSWKTGSGGGGGTPGGTNGQIQVNSSGSFGGLNLPANLAVSGSNIVPVGGLYPAVATHAARNAIPSARRSAEMLVFTQNDSIYWSWTGT